MMQPLALVVSGCRRGVSRLERRLPVAFDRDAAIAPRERVSRRERVNPFEDRSRRKRRPEREDVVETDRIELARDSRVREQRLDLRREEELIAALRVEDRAHADPVAGQEQRTLACVPDRERPLTVELPYRAGA